MTETLQQSPAPSPSPSEQRGNLIRLLLLVAAAAALAVATGALSTVVVVAVLLVMVMLHELGHFVTAKAAGMKVTECFLGFGPRLWSIRRGETEYGVKPILVGAYVRIIGMHNLEQVDPADEPRAYRQKPYWRRMSVALAGSMMHFLIAYVLLFTVSIAFGVPDTSRVRVAEIVQVGSGESPAQEAGLQVGDILVSVDGHPVERTGPDLIDYFRAHPGKQIDVVVERDGRRRTLTATLATRSPSGEPVGFLGLRPEHPLVRQDPFRVAVRSGSELGSLMGGSVRALGGFFAPGNLRDYVGQLTGEATRGEGGLRSSGSRGGSGAEGANRFLSPVGAVRLASQAARSGPTNILLLLALVNVFVGVFNLVPLLPLDGGHVAIATYERLRSRRGRRYHADVAKLLPLTYAVVVVLLTLGVTALWLDIVRPLSNPFQ